MLNTAYVTEAPEVSVIGEATPDCLAVDKNVKSRPLRAGFSRKSVTKNVPPEHPSAPISEISIHRVKPCFNPILKNSAFMYLIAGPDAFRAACQGLNHPVPTYRNSALIQGI
jgi:hypothetical protein